MTTNEKIDALAKPEEMPRMFYDDYGGGIEQAGRGSPGDRKLYWRNGKGWMPLRYATIFKKKNEAISACVYMGSKKCTVFMVRLNLGEAVYPPSRATPGAKR